MKKLEAPASLSAPALIDQKNVELGDWRAEALSRMRALIKEADPDIEECAKLFILNKRPLFVSPRCLLLHTDKICAFFDILHSRIALPPSRAPRSIAADGRLHLLLLPTFKSFVMKTIRFAFALITALTLVGCAGTNFKRPDAGTLVIGKSTSADVAQVMGKPYQTGELMKNNEKVKVSRYAYAQGAGSGRYPSVVPARAMVFSTFNDVLVGQEFVSSFAEDATDFDETKVSEVIKGKSTRADVRALLGKPNGEAIYPLIKNKDETGVIYSYSHAKGSVFNMKFYSKVLVVSFDNNGIVTDMEYTASGEK